METGLIAVVCLLFLACVGEGIRRTIKARRKARQKEIDWQQRAKELHEGSVYATRKAKPSAWASASSSPDRRSAVRSLSSPAPSPAPQPDYLDQHLIWQNLSASIPEAAEDWRPPTCSASTYASGGGGDFGGGGASSSWDNSSSSDSSSSSSSDSSSSSGSD